MLHALLTTLFCSPAPPRPGVNIRFEEQAALVESMEAEAARVAAWAQSIQVERLVAESMAKAQAELMQADLVRA
jgi:hypothetical protein